MNQLTIALNNMETIEKNPNHIPERDVVPNKDEIVPL